MTEQRKGPRFGDAGSQDCHSNHTIRPQTDPTPFAFGIDAWIACRSEYEGDWAAWLANPVGPNEIGNASMWSVADARAERNPES